MYNPTDSAWRFAFLHILANVGYLMTAILKSENT